MNKLTKAQRMKLITPEDRATIEDMPDEYMLAIHDFIHEQMVVRSGSNKRAALTSNQEGNDEAAQDQV